MQPFVCLFEQPNGCMSRAGSEQGAAIPWLVPTRLAACGCITTILRRNRCPVRPDEFPGRSVPANLPKNRREGAKEFVERPGATHPRCIAAGRRRRITSSRRYGESSDESPLRNGGGR